MLLCCTMVASNLTMRASDNCNATPITTPERNPSVMARMDLPPFSGIYSDIVASITIEQGDEYFIEAQGPEHIIQLIEPVVQKEGGTLTIKAKKEYKVEKRGLNIRIVTPKLELIYNEGVGDICTKGDFKAQMITITNKGVGNIAVSHIECQRMQVLHEGVGRVELTGKATHAVFKSEGVGNIQAYGLEVANLNAELKGVGGMKCYVTERFTCKSEGVGNIYYKGKPQQTNINSSGIGKVVHE